VRVSQATVAFGLICCLQVALIVGHSPWLDEEHALLIARAPWGVLLENLKYEGHPALWYLWLGAWDRLLGGSPWSLPLALTPIAIGLQALIWFRSPFPTTAKLLLSLSYFVIFEYGTISRSYALGALLLLTAVPLRRSVWGWVSLALAANTSAYDLLASSALGLVFFIEKPRWQGPTILACGLALAAGTVFPIAPDLYPTGGAPQDNPLYTVFRALQGLACILIPSVPRWPYQWTVYLPAYWAAIAAFTALGIGAWTLRRSLPLMVGFSYLFLAMFSMAIRTYEVSPRHAGVLFIYLVAGWWILAEKGYLSRWVYGWLTASLVCTIPFIVGAPMLPFTHHREIATWIRDHGLANDMWGAWPGREGTTITTQFGMPTINLEKDCINMFVRWDYPHERVKDPLAHIQRDNVRYVISEVPIAGGKELTHFIVGGGWETPVFIYQFAATGSPSAPACR
jgi:hypothetical protein